MYIEALSNFSSSSLIQAFLLPVHHPINSIANHSLHSSLYTPPKAHPVYLTPSRNFRSHFIAPKFTSFTCKDFINSHPMAHPRKHYRTNTAVYSLSSSSSISRALDDEFQSSLAAYNSIDSKIIDTLSALPPSKLRLTPADLATLSGVSLLEADNALIVLARILGATMQVSDDGDLVYVFPPNAGSKTIQSRVQDKIWSIKVSNFIKFNIIPKFIYLWRIGFGVALISSIAIAALTIFILVTAANSNDKDDRRGSSSSRGPDLTGIFFPRYYYGPSIFDFFYYDPYNPYAYYGGSRDRNPSQASPSDAPRKLSFLEAVYSFVFGDPDPNQDLQQTRWKNIARVIRSNKGAVTAEQLAPFLDLEENHMLPFSDNHSSTLSLLVDESYVLPVLEKFKGHPQVTDQGDIIYVFPEMQTTAQGVGSVEVIDPKAKSSSFVFQEFKLQLTRASTGQKVAVAALALLNGGLMLFLSSLLGNPTLVYNAVRAGNGPLIKLVQTIFPFLASYALTFLVAPLLRTFWISKKNAQIETRNAYRLQAANLVEKASSSAAYRSYQDLSSPESTIAKKLMDAQKYKVKTKLITENDLVFSTDDDFDRSKSDPSLDSFDRKLSQKW